ncbi:MAG TPA: hypothetical protein VGJ92_05285 [Methanocella sp.]|jgi:hypothetical protein
MSKVRVLELLPFFALIAIAAVISSAALATAGFTFPDMFDRWSFSQPASISPGSTTTVTNAYMPLDDLAVPAGFDMPFSGFNMFRSPVTSTQKSTKTVMTPAGPQTQIVDQSFDGTTGQRTTTVTNL